MTKLNIKKCISEKVEKTVGRGSFIEIEGSLYVIAQCASLAVVAINLVSGNRYSDPQLVKNPSRITEQEMEKITIGYGYIYVDNVNINYN